MDEVPHRCHWRLKKWRLHRGFTQETFAEKMGTTKATISKLERYQLYGPGHGRQKINDEWLERYCVALGITQQELAGFPESPKPIDDILKDASPSDQKRFRAIAEAFIKSDK